MNTNISIPHSEKVLRLLQCQTSYFSTYLPPSAFKRYQLKLIIPYGICVHSWSFIRVHSW